MAYTALIFFSLLEYYSHSTCSTVTLTYMHTHYNNISNGSYVATSGLYDKESFQLESLEKEHHVYKRQRIWTSYQTYFQGLNIEILHKNKSNHSKNLTVPTPMPLLSFSILLFFWHLPREFHSQLNSYPAIFHATYTAEKHDIRSIRHTLNKSSKNKALRCRILSVCRMICPRAMHACAVNARTPIQLDPRVVLNSAHRKPRCLRSTSTLLFMRQSRYEKCIAGSIYYNSS